MPSAEVATTALTSLARSASSTLRAVGGVELPRVGGDVVAARDEVAGEAFGLGHGQHVDDPRAGERASASATHA